MKMSENNLLETAIREYETRHYQKSYPIFRKLAKKNIKEALYYLGLHHFYGRGVQKMKPRPFRCSQKRRLNCTRERLRCSGNATKKVKE